MSIRLMTQAMDDCAETVPLRRYILLVLADYANDESRKAWPSIDSIARRTQMDRRTVQRHLNALIKSGNITRIKNAGRNGVNVYLLHIKKIEGGGGSVPGRQAATGAAEMDEGGGTDGQKGRQAATRTLKNPQGTPTCAADASREVFSALSKLNGSDLGELTKAGREKIEAAAKQITDASPDVTAAEIAKRATVFVERFPQASVTAFALVHHWASLKPRRPVEVAPSRARRAEPPGWKEIWPEVFDDAVPNSWEEVPDILTRDIRNAILDKAENARKKFGGKGAGA